MARCLYVILLVTAFSASGAEELDYQLFEELPPGKLIGNLPQDLRLGYSDVLRYKVVSKSHGPQPVRVSNNTGKLYTTTTPLDREAICPEQVNNDIPCFFELQVVVLPNEHFRLVKVKIQLDDINDNSPTFPNSLLNITVPENSPVGSEFPVPAATDRDIGDNFVQSYDLEPGRRPLVNQGMARQPPFSLVLREGPDGDRTPQLVVTAPLDREKQEMYELHLRAKDGGMPPRTGSAILLVEIEDINDNEPSFKNPHLEVSVSEAAAPGTSVAKLHANDPDSGQNGEVLYSFSPRVSAQSRRLFRLDDHTGLLSLRGPLDREVMPIHRLLVVANDRGHNPSPTTATVMVTVTDANDNTPSLAVHAIKPASKDGTVHISELDPIGTPIVLIDITDPDQGPNGHVTYHIVGTDTPFSLRPAYPDHDMQLLLETATALDYELRQDYMVEVIAVDGGIPARTGTAVVHVHALDENDNAPVFLPQVMNVSVHENNAPGVQVLTLRARDRDSGHNSALIYSLAPGAPRSFRLNASTGVLSITESLDREQNRFFRLTAIARDRGVPPLEGNATVFVRVLDRNDNAPRFTNKELNFFLSENLPRSTTVGVLSASDVDEGKNGLVTFAMVGGGNSNNIFTVNPVTGMLEANVSFDRERKASYAFDVYAIDGGDPPLTATAKVTINVMDINDNAPTVVVPPSNSSYHLVPLSTGIGTSVAEVVAVDYDSGENAALSYSIASPNPSDLFSIDAATGNVTLLRALRPTDRGLHQLAIKVSDGGFPEPLQVLALVNLFVNDSFNNATYVQEMVARGLRKQPEKDGQQTTEESGRYTILVAMAAGAAFVVLLVTSVIAALRCRGTRQKGNGGGPGCRGKTGETWLSAAPPELRSSKKSVSGKTVSSAPYSIVTIEEGKGDEPTYQSIAEALGEPAGEDRRTIPRHNTFRPCDNREMSEMPRSPPSVAPNIAVEPPRPARLHLLAGSPGEIAGSERFGPAMIIAGDCKRLSSCSEHYSGSDSSGSQAEFAQNAQIAAGSKPVRIFRYAPHIRPYLAGYAVGSLVAMFGQKFV
uniref:protocadherin-9-like isoform X3 n=1 Tax=Myxine glutinosa TaxID=7769 RepID=UPI00358F8A41